MLIVFVNNNPWLYIHLYKDRSYFHCFCIPNDFPIITSHPTLLLNTKSHSQTLCFFHGHNYYVHCSVIPSEVNHQYTWELVELSHFHSCYALHIAQPYFLAVAESRFLNVFAWDSCNLSSRTGLQELQPSS